MPERFADRAAAEEALALATSRLERASAGVAKWRDKPGGQRSRALSHWEKAWREYLLALIVADALIPRRLHRWQRVLARLTEEEWGMGRRGAPPR